MHQADRIAGVVVLYNPDKNVVDNILSYIDQIDILFAVDNSDKPQSDILERIRAINRLIYIGNDGNLGVAKALNIGATKAIEHGYGFLLTMDQDSNVAPGMIRTMLACASAKDVDKIGIISPRHYYKSAIHPSASAPCEEILTTMTSGNLLNLKIYSQIGPFVEDLFIDFVDDEYCLRLSLKGFKTVRANSAILDHSLGTITEHRFISKFATGNHPPIRRYYGFRNKFFLHRIYKEQFPAYFRHFFRLILFEIFIVIFYESNSCQKLKMMLRGYLDYRKGVFGKYIDRE